MTTITRTVPCSTEIKVLAESAALRSDAVLILPDKVRELDGNPTALFREESQALRQIGAELSIDVELLVPDQAAIAVQTERADDIILPIVIGLTTNAIGAVLGTYLERLIERWRNSPGRQPEVRYRRVSIDPDGSAELTEITGSGADVLAIIRGESSDHAN